MVMSGFGIPGEIKVFLNHIYEYKKGVRNMILCTLNEYYLPMAIERLENQNICYLKQEAGQHTVNIYFGCKECIDTIRLLVTKPLNRLSPEEDFILGTLLGYDMRKQCERFCMRKQKHMSLAAG